MTEKVICICLALIAVAQIINGQRTTIIHMHTHASPDESEWVYIPWILHNESMPSDSDKRQVITDMLDDWEEAHKVEMPHGDKKT